MKNMAMRLLREEDGQGIVEYGLIIAAVAIAAIVAVWAFGDKIVTFFNGLSFDRPAST